MMHVTLATVSLQKNLPEVARSERKGGREEDYGWLRFLVQDNMGQGTWLFIAGSDYCRVFFQRLHPEGGSGAHQDEGAQGCLFLMVASEHSASEVSQSESPN